MSRAVRSTRAVLIAAALLLSRGAFAQPMFPPTGPANPPPPTTPGAGKPSGAASAAPGGQGHAAPTAEDIQRLQTQEPSLPQNPLEVPLSVRTRIGTDSDPDRATGETSEVHRHFYGPYYSEESGNYRFRTLFPLWIERTNDHDRASLYGTLYFQRRTPTLKADVLFPFFWKLQDGPTYTTILGPFLHRESGPRSASDEPSGFKLPQPGRHDNWLAPLVFEGSTDDGSGYLHVPPLLTFTDHTNHSGFDLVGPLFCRWKGGRVCDPRSTDDIDLGVAPFYLYGRDERSEYELIPPLLHYYHYSEIGDSSFNLWGPLLFEHDREHDVFDVMPFYWHNWAKNEDHTTIFPLFHYGYKGLARLLVTPLFLWGRGEKAESTFVTWGYARYRGRTELDMITPLFWQYRDPDIGLTRTLLFPFYYRNTSPRSSDLALFPLYGHFYKPAISETNWITPFFRHTNDLTGWETDIYPLFYFGRENRSSHLVLAPLLWDFASPKSRATVVLPAYYRFSDETTTSQLVLNTYYHERKVRNGSEWEVHFFPAFSYGESPNGHWWNILYGLAGYTHEGTMSKMRLLYIPIPLSE